MQPRVIIETARTVDDARQDSRRIVEAVAYLNQCREGDRRLAVITGDSAEDLATVTEQFLHALPESVTVARTHAPTDSRHAFIESLLMQFGFDPFDAPVDSLQRLLVVVLRQSSGEPGSNVLLIEEPQSCGPRVLETMRELLAAVAGMQNGPLFVLIGHNDLNRVLDSTAMASLNGLLDRRFCLDGDLPQTAASPRLPEPASATGPSAFVVLRDGAAEQRIAIDRDRVLIGRAEHNDITLPGRYISRQHALLLRSLDGDWLIDLKSTNGTIVNSKLISRCRLAPGDIIDFGDFRVRYESSSAAVADCRSAAAEEPELLSATVIMRSLKALHEAGEPQAPGQRRHRSFTG